MPFFATISMADTWQDPAPEKAGTIQQRQMADLPIWGKIFVQKP